MMNFNHKFNKIDELFSSEINSFEDCIVLSEKILEDENQILKTFLSSKNEDFELVHDILELIENIKEYGGKENSKHYEDLIYFIVSTCLSLKEESLSSLLIQRLYRRGFASNLVDSFIKYYSDVVDCESVEDFEKVCVLGVNDTVIQLCCNVLRKLSKFFYVKLYEGEYRICIDSYSYYNTVRRTISHLFCSSLNSDDKWNYLTLSKLFHPLSRLYLPCLILYVLIDELPQECKIEMLHNLSSFYCDAELMRTVHPNDVTYLAGFISRLLVSTKVDPKYDLSSLSGFLTKAITSGLSTLDPVIRQSAMTIAESYSEFTYNNSDNKDESLLFKFDTEYNLDSPSLFNLAAFRSKLIVNPEFSNEEVLFNTKDNQNIEESKKIIAQLEKKKEQEEEHKKKEMDLKVEEMENGNESFLEFIFKGVPEINVETIDGYIKESWIRPPQHIVQCYERLLSKPARGDVDFECLIASSLDRVEEEIVENKILRISQTLLYLPQIISKNESIMEKYSIPLSNILLKLEDLDLYRDKIAEIVKMSRNQSLVNESQKSKELAIAPKFVSKDPEILVLVSLVLMTYYCPMNICQFYSSHLFDSEYSLGIRITMLLCIQYTAVAFNSSMDPNHLVDKIIKDTTKLTKGAQSISGLKTCNPLDQTDCCDYKDETQVVLTPKNDEDIKPPSDLFSVNKSSMVFVRKFNNQATSLLLDSLKVYLSRNASERAPMDEDVVVGIFETLVILVGSSSIDNNVLADLDDVVQYFVSRPIGQRLRSTLDMVSIVLTTIPNPRLCV